MMLTEDKNLYFIPCNPGQSIILEVSLSVTRRSHDVNAPCND